MERKKSLEKFVLCVLMFCAVTIKAETIFEKFDTDPTLGGWTKSTPAGSTYTYNAAGYLDAGFKRDSLLVDRYTKALSQTYSRSQEFWWEFDIQIDNIASDAIVKMAQIGLFNSGNTNAQNATTVGFSVPNDTAATDRFDVQSFRNLSGVTARSVAISPAAPYDSFLRIKGHFYNNTLNEGWAEAQVYDIPTGNLIGSGSVKILTATDTLNINLFGLGNLNASATSGSVVTKVDNLYFSTTEANAASVNPSFIPEPATVSLLTLGGIVLGYRRSKR